MEQKEPVIVTKPNYTPTDEDLVNDRLQQEWQERRNEEARQSWLRTERNRYYNSNFN